MLQVLALLDDSASAVSDWITPVFDSSWTWVLIPLVLVAVWWLLRLAVSHGIFGAKAVPAARNSTDPGAGIRESHLAEDCQQLVEVIRQEVIRAEDQLEKRAQRLVGLIERAERTISRFQGAGISEEVGDSLHLLDRCGIELGEIGREKSAEADSPVSLDVVRGRSDGEKAIQQKIEDLVISGADPQEIAWKTDRPIGEIQVIMALLQRKRSEST